MILYQFQQFSRAVATAAAGQQQDIRDALVAFSNTLTVSAASMKEGWPFIKLPSLAHFSKDYVDHSGCEAVAYMPVVRRSMQEEWISFTNRTNEDFVKEAHMATYGSLENLTPKYYHPYMTKVGSNGLEAEATDLDTYYPMYGYYPPPRTYGIMNWNMHGVPDYASAINAAVLLKNETIITRVRPLATNVALTKEQHDRMHSKQRESESGFPHSFAFYSVKKDLEDKDSPVVAVLVSVFAWDYALRNLLPDGVTGIYATVSNNCNQTYSFYLDGKDALFRGDGDKHDRRFDHMEEVLNLGKPRHPLLVQTPGHCRYKMVRTVEAQIGFRGLAISPSTTILRH